MFYKKKNILLLIAFILGICILVFIIGALFVSIGVFIESHEMVKVHGEDYGINLYREDFSQVTAGERRLEVFLMCVIIFFAAIINVFALIFNFIGWKINNNKKIIIAAILYIFLVIYGLPSSILCFISYAKMRKIEKK